MKGHILCSSVAQRIRIELNILKNKPGFSALCTLVPFFFSLVKHMPQWIIFMQEHTTSINLAHRVYKPISASLQERGGMISTDAIGLYRRV